MKIRVAKKEEVVRVLVHAREYVYVYVHTHVHIHVHAHVNVHSCIFAQQRVMHLRSLCATIRN